MPPKRPSGEATDSSPSAKKIKEGPESSGRSGHMEEGIFEAARRRHAERQKAAKAADDDDGDKGTSAASSESKTESHHAWEERWMALCPTKAIVRAVGAIRRSMAGVSATSTGSHVYVAVHSSEAAGRQHLYPEIRLLGFYSNVSSANEHVLGHFIDKSTVYHELQDEKYWTRGLQNLDGYYGSAWDVDASGCLSLWCRSVRSGGPLKVYVSKQMIRDHPPDRRPHPRHEAS